MAQPPEGNDAESIDVDLDREPHGTKQTFRFATTLPSKVEPVEHRYRLGRSVEPSNVDLSELFPPLQRKGLPPPQFGWVYVRVLQSFRDEDREQVSVGQVIEVPRRRAWRLIRDGQATLELQAGQSATEAVRDVGDRQIPNLVAKLIAKVNRTSAQVWDQLPISGTGFSLTKIPSIEALHELDAGRKLVAELQSVVDRTLRKALPSSPFPALAQLPLVRRLGSEIVGESLPAELSKRSCVEDLKAIKRLWPQIRSPRATTAETTGAIPPERPAAQGARLPPAETGTVGQTDGWQVVEPDPRRDRHPSLQLARNCEALESGVGTAAPLSQTAKRQPEQAPATPETRGRTLDPGVAARRTIVGSHPEMKTAQLCERFDLDGRIALPPEWKDEFGVEDWESAYGRQPLKKRIDTMVSKDRRWIHRSNLP